MEQIYSSLLTELLKEIDQCWQSDLSEIKRFENCFWIAERYCKELEKRVLKKGFANEAEEIKFFKEVKPRLTSMVEFFVIATEALWFAGSEVVCSSQFWKEETQKYNRFRERQHRFVDYYEAGETHLDADYFLQANDESIGDVQSIMFDENHRMQFRKDWLVRSYLAHKMYHGFAQEKLRAIEMARQQKSGMPVVPSQKEKGSFSALLLTYLE